MIFQKQMVYISVPNAGRKRNFQQIIARIVVKSLKNIKNKDLKTKICTKKTRKKSKNIPKKSRLKVVLLGFVHGKFISSVIRKNNQYLVDLIFLKGGTE